jgi:hypothetical protein
MVSVSTGGPRIDDVDKDYRDVYGTVAQELSRRGIRNPLPYASLWDWHGRWSSGDLPTYRSRRSFVSELLNPLVKQIATGHREVTKPTGWSRVDRVVGEAREQLASAQHEEHFQSVGLLCREILISLAQAVYDQTMHPSVDGKSLSETDAKGMLDAYIARELGGASNEYVRTHARSALDLANHLQHTRTADFRRAAMCVEATTSAVNVIAIVAGKRDPK